MRLPGYQGLDHADSEVQTSNPLVNMKRSVDQKLESREAVQLRIRAKLTVRTASESTVQPSQLCLHLNRLLKVAVPRPVLCSRLLTLAAPHQALVMRKLPYLALALAVVGIAVAFNPLPIDNSLHYARNWLHNRWSVCLGNTLQSSADCSCEVKCLSNVRDVCLLACRL